MEAAAPPGFMVKRGARGKTSSDLDRAASLSSAPSLTSAAAVSPSAGSGQDDAPFGYERVPPVTASVAAFQRRCEWFYVDPSGEEHGPVPLQKILNWHKKGHFPEDVKVRRRRETVHNAPGSDGCSCTTVPGTMFSGLCHLWYCISVARALLPLLSCHAKQLLRSLLAACTPLAQTMARQPRCSLLAVAAGALPLALVPCGSAGQGH